MYISTTTRNSLFQTILFQQVFIKSIKLSSMGLIVSKIKAFRQLQGTKVIVMMHFQVLKIIGVDSNVVLFQT
jgi:hypothetical protein